MKKLHPFVERRLQQLVREEFERNDWEAFVRQIVREELYGRPVEQARPQLKLVK